MKNWIDTSFTTNSDGDNVPNLGGYETNSDVQYSVMDRGDGTCLTRVTAPSTTMSNIEGATETTVKTDSEADSILMANRPQATLENLDVPDVEVDQELNAFTVNDLLDADEQNCVAIAVTAHRDIPREDLRTLYADYGVTDPTQLAIAMSGSERATLVSDYSLSIPSHFDAATAARAVVTTPTYGNQVLQDQESTAMNKVAKAKGLSRADELTANTRADNSGTMGATAEAMLSGKNAEHDKMLEYIKGNTTAVPWDGDTNPPAKGKRS